MLSNSIFAARAGRQQVLAVTTLALFALSACGGGSDAPAPPPAPVSVQIAASNQDSVARAAANAVVSASTAGAVVPLSIDARVTASAKSGSLAAAPSLAGAASVMGVLQRFTNYALGYADAKSAAASQVRALAVATQSQACASGGTITVTVNDADNSGQLSGGDSVSFAFNACRPSAAETINGSMTLTVTTASSTAISGTLGFAALGATTADGSFSITGSVSLSWSRQGTLATYQMVIGAGGLTTAVTSTSPQFSDSITLGGGFEQTVTYDSAALPAGSTVPGLTTARVNGSITATSIGGTVTISTSTPFQHYEIDAYPRAGQVLVTGAGGSRLQLTALSATTVRLELDANGDGMFEQSRDVPWGTLI